VIRRRLVPLVLVVTALLAIVALAARGRPLGKSGGKAGGLPTVFWDYAFTTVVIVLVAAALVAIAGYFRFQRDVRQPEVFQARTARALAVLIVMAVILVVIGRYTDLYHLLHPNGAPNTSTSTTPIPSGGQGGGGKPGTHHVQFRWEELVVVLGVFLALGAIAATRSRLRPPPLRRRRAEEMLAAALDESLDDLRAEPDLRRAIVAAYARMEATLAAAGLPRRPAEAPLEYLERALLALDTSAGAVSRLTDLFEWARFSQHEPEPSMRDEAVDALVAVRDELRAAEPAWT